MKRIAILLCCIIAMATTKSCRFNPFDPPHYETPLPNGLHHFSNGGEQGRIRTSIGNNAAIRIYPADDEWFCNEFAVIADDVIGVEIQYAPRAFVDPPIAKRWFYLDTKDRTATTFDSLDGLREYCESLGHATMPHFGRRTSETYRTDLH